MSEQRVLVIGGAVYDITGRITGDTIPADSNPSSITDGCGGVGRNIAENLGRMGVDTAFLTARGEDSFSRLLTESCLNAHVDVSRYYPSRERNVYLSILDHSGELLMAAADVTQFENVPPEFFLQQKEYIASFPYVFTEANATAEQLKAIASCCKGQLFADAVSARKAVRLRGILPLLDTLKVNRAELSAITGMGVQNAQEVTAAAKSVINMGVKRVFVSMGKEGSCAFTADEDAFLPAFPAVIANVNGAGDAFSASLILSAMEGRSLADTLLLGTSASHIALEGTTAVNPQMSRRSLLEKYEMLQNAGTGLGRN